MPEATFPATPLRDSFIIAVFSNATFLSWASAILLFAILPLDNALRPNRTIEPWIQTGDR